MKVLCHIFKKKRKVVVSTLPSMELEGGNNAGEPALILE